MTVESNKYLTEQIVTYLGNKRSIIPKINSVVLDIKKEINREKLKTADLFAGTGIVSRALKQHSSHIIANDLELYSQVINQCYLANEADLPRQEVADIIQDLNDQVRQNMHPKNGFISELYAPKDDRNIQKGERVFYTKDNAHRLDFFAQEIAKLPQHLRPFLLGPLLAKASVHANTGGVFKGFYKDRTTGIGKFGASGANALSRILAPIYLQAPLLSNFSASSQIFHEDANLLAENLPGLDFCYLDPPYNQHPYSSNYFMLNLLCDYQRPSDVSLVSGIPKDWNRSVYNQKRLAQAAICDLIEKIPSSFILLSVNDEGFIDIQALIDRFSKRYRVSDVSFKYNTYRAARNLSSRSIYVSEHLVLIKKGGHYVP